MSQSARDLLVRGIAAAKAKDKDEARFYLEWVLNTDADRQQRAQAWLWLSEINDDPAKKRNCLEEVLALDPANGSARRGLAILDGRLDAAEVIDPDRQPAASQATPAQEVKTQRFICHNCGAKMAFKPNGASLHCQHCGHEQTLLAALQEDNLVREHDFTVAMATAKGHTRPVGMHPFSCQGCGASFLLAPKVLSLSCPYCGSAHVTELSETQHLIPPEGLIPFEISHGDARNTFHQWIGDKGFRGKAQVAPVRGLYFPAWTFDLSGEIRWQGHSFRSEGYSKDAGASLFQMSLAGSKRASKPALEQGSYLIHEDDVLVPATHTLPADLISEQLACFSLSAVIPYTQGYLADWPAEVYEIAVSDASLVARRKVLEKAQRSVKSRVDASLGPVKDLKLNTAGIIIESFKLILLPIWVTRYRLEDTIYHVLINGQTGGVRAQTPRSWLRKLFGGLF